jgi:hypothetical protein
MKNNLLWTVSIVLLLFASVAHGQATRTWVSGVGDDANPCSRTAPCKTFAGAISKTAAGGEIDALDQGGYGAVTITKAITIDGGGTFASILVSGTNAIVVQAAASDVVNLRNLSINGIGSGLDGIRFLAGQTLNIQNVVIFNFTGDGIDASLTTSGDLNVENVSISDCTGAGGTGIRTAAAAPPLGVELSQVRVQNCTFGVFVGNGVVLSVRDSDLSLNDAGLAVSSANAQANVDNVRFASNGFGINASAGLVRIMKSTFFSNSIGINPAGGSICSTGDSRFAGNGSNGVPSANSGPCATTTQ